MRNLKKILSLVLAMAMMLSVMVVGAGAAFKDEDDFSAEYVTAAEVLTNLGVLKGYEDGSFQPKGEITRAETAALIYRVVTADVADAQKDIYTAMTNGFDDVKNADWFAGYVNFCANAKFVAGYGDGTFGPNDKVTGYQTLAMILRAVGYDHNGEFIGTGWELKTAAVAQQIGMLENVTAEQLGSYATRELVAELIFQAITCAPTVHWNDIFQTYRFDKTTLGWNSFELFKVEDVVLANEYANLGADTADALDAGKTLIGTATYKLSTDLNVIGEKVRVWIADDTAVSTPVSLAETADWSNLDKKELTEDQEDEWKDAKGDDAATFYNYDKTPAFNIFAKGVHVKAIDNNDDGVYDYVLAVKEDLATIKTIATDGEIVLNNVKSADDQVVYDGAEVGDVVLVVTFDGATYIEKADSINGIVSGYSTKGAIPTATIGGKAYAISALGNTSGLETFDNVRDTYQAGADWNGKYYTYYQDCYGNIIAYEEAGENATEYGLILDYDVYKSGPFKGDLTWRPLDGINFGDVYVKFLTVAGEVETAKVDADFEKYFLSGENNNYASITRVAAGDVVSYNINEEGEFCIQYTYAHEDAEVETDPEKNLAWVDMGNSEKLYNVGDDLVVFYYAASPTYNDSELLGTLLPNIPVYGVLTGDEAIADLEAGKDIHQMNVSDGSSNHSSKFDGEAYMFNIRGHIDPFVGYCYVKDFNEYEANKIGNESFITYNAIDASGKPIDVTVKAPLGVIEDGGLVYKYYTLDVNGEVYNFLVPTDNYVEADIHQGKGGMEMYTENDQQGKLVDAPEVYADVTTAAGGTTEISAKYCTTALVVLEGNEAVAVFVTEKCDNDIDYVDVTIDGVAMHKKIGSEIKKTGCYTWTIDGVAQAPIHKAAVVKVAADWEDKTVEFTKVDPCYTCVPHKDVREGVITKIAKDSTGTVCAQNLNGYEELTDALDNMYSIDFDKTSPVKIHLSNKDGLQVAFAIYTSTADAEKGSNSDYVVGDVIQSGNLPSEGVLVLKVTSKIPSDPVVNLNCPYECTADAVYVAIKL